MHALTATVCSAARLTPVALVLAVAGCSLMGGGNSHYGPEANEQNNPAYAETLKDSKAPPAPRELATLIFYRPGKPTGNDVPLNVYANGRYVSSLLPGGYAEHTQCAGAMQVAAVFDDARIRHLGQHAQETVFPVEAGKSYYLKAEVPNGTQKATLTPVSSSQVLLSEYRRQSHALVRAPSCGADSNLVKTTAPAVPAAAVKAPPVVAAAPVAAVAVGLSSRVAAPLESWRAAWERGDYAAYTSFYADEFTGDQKTHADWLKHRRARLNNTAKQVTVKELAVNATADKVTTDFRQGYKSGQFDDQGQKRLVWKLFGNELKIVEETFAPAK